MNPYSIFDLKSEISFKKKTLEIFKFQFDNNNVYRSFCELLCKHPSEINDINDIPFLPIDFFKTKAVITSNSNIQQTFTSSGTTGSKTSKHHVKDLKLYENSFIKGFEQFYGSINNYTILGLLPSYLERDGSSLVYMVNTMIEKSNSPKSGFYLKDLEKLRDTIFELESKKEKTLLIGVSYALLDLIESYEFKLEHTIIMETGGMKGNRKEMVKSELHSILKKGFGVEHIHGEYGMTEMLSQAYSKRDGFFSTANWMKVLIRDPEDNMTILTNGKCGGINIIDLANIHSCSFIATQDLGKLHSNGLFELLGRFDQSDIRGCNLMVV
tara:strand:+ start:641 stop:1618 length:978 start_codon:yes stop_codon:yes gene_type:complete